MSRSVYLTPTERESLKRVKSDRLSREASNVEFSGNGGGDPVIITRPICDICGHKEAEHEVEEDNAYCLGGIATVEGNCACKKFVEPRGRNNA